MCCLQTAEMPFQSFSTSPYLGSRHTRLVWLCKLLTGTPHRHFIECKHGLQSLVKAFMGGPRTGVLHLVWQAGIPCQQALFYLHPCYQ